jgi:ApaG protein
MALAEAISHDFQVTAISRFMPERSNQEIPIFFFAYWITIKNQGAVPAKLLNRYWNITDADGRINEVRGEGVVGEKPLIKPGQSFEYNSFCPLPTNFGFMKGYYEMQGADKNTFQVEIPQFRLATPKSAN